MASWSEFVAASPHLAAGIRALILQYGPGLAYLATVRRDGGPRVHPVSPVFTADALYCFVVRSPKRHDLERDGRYALHSYPPEEADDEAYLTGRATPVTDPAVIARLATALNASPEIDWRLFELSVETAMLRHHDNGSALPFAAILPPITHTWHDPVTALSGDPLVAAATEAAQARHRPDDAAPACARPLRHGSRRSGTVGPLAGVVQWQNISFPS